MNDTMKLEAFLLEHYKFRFNVVTGVLESRYNETSSIFRRVEDYDLNSILRECKHQGIKTNMTDLRSLLISDFTPRFNPFWEYFKGLPEWDGKTDFIDQLACTVKTTNDTLWRKSLKKWFVAMAASALRDHVINHTVIVFTGPQGIGKTTWILNLVPPPLKEYCYSGTINPANKDTLIFLAECMLINLDELENLNKTELGSIKELITKDKVKLRRPYGYVSEQMPRRASFAGSVNTTQFLSDTTGSRRFLCFETLSIEYNHGISIDNAYSQAVALIASGFRYWFDKDEIQEIIKSNETYRLISAEEELLLSTFKPCQIGTEDSLMTATEIFIELQQHAKIALTPASLNRLGKALHANNFERFKRKGRQVYAVRRKASYTEPYPQIADNVLLLNE